MCQRQSRTDRWGEKAELKSVAPEQSRAEAKSYENRRVGNLGVPPSRQQGQQEPLIVTNEELGLWEEKAWSVNMSHRDRNRAMDLEVGPPGSGLGMGTWGGSLAVGMQTTVIKGCWGFCYHWKALQARKD